MKPSVRIAIVDDHADIRFTLSEICKLQGWETAEAANYHEALRLMDAGTFDLFIVDYHLPEYDGVEIVREARKRFPKSIILVLTVEEKENVAKRFMEAGANDYALKPIKAIDLITRINVHLKYKWVSEQQNDVSKGINANTLAAVRECFPDNADALTAEQVGEAVGISTKSAYRYISYLAQDGYLEAQPSFEGTVGRPKTYYRKKIG